MNNTKLTFFEKNKHCLEFKCTADENPVCVKLSTVGEFKTKKDIYIELINECEAKYIKCHKGNFLIIFVHSNWVVWFRPESLAFYLNI